MRVLVTGRCASEGARARCPELVTAVLEAFSCDHLITWEQSKVVVFAKFWAKQHKVPVTHFDAGAQKKKPVKVSVWELLASGQPDLVIGFWPSARQMELLQMMANHGFKVLCQKGLSTPWIPLEPVASPPHVVLPSSR